MTARRTVPDLLLALGLACGLADVVQAQAESDPTAEAAQIPEPTIRAAARRILAESAFSGFDHFDANPRAPQASATPPGSAPTDEGTTTASESEADTNAAGEAASNRPRNWWEDLRNNPRKGSTQQDSGSGQSTNSSTGAQGTREAASDQPERRAETSTTPRSGQGSNSNEGTTAGRTPNPAGEAGTREAPASRSNSDAVPDGRANSERPQRSESSADAAPRRPAQLGSDGVERPVRFAPKPPPAPRPSSGSNWNFDFGLGWLLSGVSTALGAMFHGIAYLALALVVLLLVALAARALVELLARRRNHVHIPGLNGTLLADERSPGEIAADVYLQQALELARLGDYRAAVSQLLLGAMSAIERRQWIRYRRGLTLADYLRSVRAQPTTYTGLATVVRIYEPIEYGRQPATADHFQHALAGYQQGIATLP